jgi:long-chain-fatty-acid--[acyl-carrier-protein] ligase
MVIEETLLTVISNRMKRSERDLVILDRAAAQWRRHPWQEVHAMAERMATTLLDRSDGVPPTVGLVGDPTLPFVASLPATWMAGGKFSIAPGPVRGADSARWAQATTDRFADAGVSIVLSHGESLSLLRAVNREIPVNDIDEITRYARRWLVPLACSADPLEVAILQSTAGSTGVPQTVAIPERAVLANIYGLVDRFDLNDTDIACSWLPLYHDMGLLVLLNCMVRDLEIWLAPPAAFTSAPFNWLTWISDSRATVTAAPNFAYNLVGRYSSRSPEVDLSTLRIALNGGEPVDCEGFERFSKEMCRFGFDASAATPAYGLAESTCAVTAPVCGAGLRYDEISATNGSSGVRGKHAILGVPITGMEVRIRPTEAPTFECVQREIGEVEIRGSSMMSGYLGSPSLQQDEWFPTGDLGYVTSDGLVVCGRIKEVIQLAGRNIFPSEIERVAATVKGVRAGAVVATETHTAGRSGLAIVAEHRGARPAVARERIVERVAAECGVVAAVVELVDPGHLPRTTSGKLRRTDVRNWFQSRRPAVSQDGQSIAVSAREPDRGS